MRVVSILFALIICAAVAEGVDFATDIEPIFRAKCYSCHGKAQQLGQLRLDSHSVVMQPGPSGQRVVPGEPEQSTLYQRVAGLGERDRMPLGGHLSEAEIGRIREWIRTGAVWPEDRGTRAGLNRHWAFIPPEREAPPPIGRDDWAVNPIDNFVLARLEAEGLEPSPRASKETLVRRLSLDLTGLPPSIEETEEFVADAEPGAYERLIERLLASPHYGERWGRIWLDAARYADSDGFEKDKPRRVWFFRDWVVEALNRDMPYDRFIVHQIAGDLLPGASQNEHVATGFLRNSMINEEGGANPEQFRMEAMFDRMDAVGKAVLGLTVQCAQCHDHKYDPLTQRDYYRMFAFLNNSHESERAVYTPAEEQTRNKILAGVRKIEEELQRRTPDWRDRMAAWERSAALDQPEWTVLDTHIELGSGEKYLVLPDKSILAQGFKPSRNVVSPEARLESGTIRAIRLELLTDPRLPLGGPGRSIFGTGALTEFEVEVAPARGPQAWKKVKLSRATADVNPPVRWVDSFLFPDKENKRRILGDVDFAIDGYEMSAWDIDAGPGRRNQPRKAVFQLAEPIVADQPLLLKFNLVMKHGGWNPDDNQSLNLGRYRLSYTADENASADPLPRHLRDIISAGSGERRSAEEEAAAFSYWRTTVRDWADDNRRIEALWQRHPEGSSQLVMNERDKPRATHMLQRGDFLRPTEQVKRGVPGFLHAMPETGQTPGRLAFAEWLVDRNAPTTARAIVNRLWQGHFGTGIVETAEDLGRQSADPSHPELLNWLAVELMENGWSLKHIHRSIALSETYRQSSRVSTELLERDPKNRLLARASRFRVDGEIVRDIALASSGLLTHEIGGPPVYPPAPGFLFLPPASYGPKRWYVEKGSQRYRRALYAFRYRSVPFPVLATFDTPTGNFACVKRDRSNTPLQALVTLNETVFLEAARELGHRTWREGGENDSDRLNFAFKRVLARSPRAAERAELLSLLDSQRARLAAGELDAEGLAVGSESSAAPNQQPPAMELAPWTAVSRVLLNLDEAITKE